MKSFFCIILFLLTYIKKCKWNSDFAISFNTNTSTIRPSNFWPIVIKISKFLKYSAEWGVKGQLFSSRPSSKSAYRIKSVSNIWWEQGVTIQKIFGLWGLCHPVFGRFVLMLSCSNYHYATEVFQITTSCFNDYISASHLGRSSGVLFGCWRR